MTAELKGIHAKTFQDLDVIKDVLKLDEEKIAELEAQIEKMKCLLNEIYSEYGFSELVKIRNDLPLEIQEVIKEIKEK